MRTELVLALAPVGPVHQRIADALIASIRSGRLRPGDRIPGSRGLAESLGVHRNTVLRALGALAAEGWIETSQARGTFVTESLPLVTPRASRGLPTTLDRPTSAPYPLRGFVASSTAKDHVTPQKPPKRALVRLFGGIPDLTRAPRAEVARAYRRAILSSRSDPLDYGDARGELELRAAIARLLAESRGLPNDPDQILVTRGSQMALFLASRILLAPGDVVAVEAWGYRPAWEALRAAGADVRPIPVDESGLDVSALAELAKRERVRAVYLTPHHQYPTTVVLSASRRIALLELARRERFAILEDDYDHEFHFEGRPVLPLASADSAGNVVYIGTLSKILAPGLRVGFLVATPDMIERASGLRTFVDRQGDRAVERAVAELLDDGTVQRHARRMRRLYHERRDAIADAIRATFGDDARFTMPQGGLALWTEFPGVDVETWSARSQDAGVAIHTAARFAFDARTRPFLRLGYGGYPPDVLRKAVATLAKTRPRR